MHIAWPGDVHACYIVGLSAYAPHHVTEPHMHQCPGCVRKRMQPGEHIVSETPIAVQTFRCVGGKARSRSCPDCCYWIAATQRVGASVPSVQRCQPYEDNCSRN